ncbi:sugar phosphate isomerase/epimerase [Candidatus Peribacteria bacterium]|nr:sugar phosphate isomerase/epimerase [Candidatus Peribacteria bacterium]
MKYGMNMLLWTTEVTDADATLLNDLKEAGFDGIEVPLFDTNVTKSTKLRPILDDIGLERTAVTICSADSNPVSSITAKAAIDHLKRAIDSCHELGVKVLCGPFHSALGVFSDAGPTAEELECSQNVMRTVAEYAKEAEVMLALESLNRFECYLLNCAEDTAKFVDAVDHPNLRSMYDTFHAHIEEKNIIDAIKNLGNRIVHVHASANDRSTPGTGAVDWENTFDGLYNTSYDGWIVIEAFGRSMPDLIAATKIWRSMFNGTELELAIAGLKFLRREVRAAWGLPS